MIISKKYKYIFVKPNKIGGTSICAALPAAGLPFDGHSQFDGDHQLLAQIEDSLTPTYFKSFFVFSFVRNPWDRALSAYFYQKRKELPRRLDRGEELTCTADNLINSKNFRDGLQHVLSSVGMLRPFSDYFKNKAGVIDLDFVGRVEHMQRDFGMVCRKLGVAPYTLPYRNKTTHQHYTEYYDDETREMVAKTYAKDIEYFGYKFGE